MAKRPFFLLLSAISLIFYSCTQDTDELLTRARDQINNNCYISYDYTTYWPNFIGETDTTVGRTQFARNTNNNYPYDYIDTNEQYDLTYIDNTAQLIVHEDRVIRIYDQEYLVNKPSQITEKIPVMYSPIELLKEEGWKYKKDTTIDSRVLIDYFLVEQDTVYEKLKIHVERHIFLDPANAQLVRYERRAYQDEKLTQKIIRSFSDYRIEKRNVRLAYDLPDSYISQFGDSKSLKPLKVGQKAPDFLAKTTNGDTLSLGSLRGKKVLLDFSVINCGYCKAALDHINKDDFTRSDKVEWIYITPADDDASMKKYQQKVGIRFPIVANREDLGKTYGVSGYPTFYLIDEKGVIEAVQVGFKKDFLDKFKI